MAAPSDNLLRYIRSLVVRAESHEATDAALLDRFIADRDERAFSALVDRHGALVLQVCWHILRNSHDAQDAFQSTFLVLARRAGTIHPREALPAWLHGVARRVALKTRCARLRRQRVVRPLDDSPIDARFEPPTELVSREMCGIVDDEVRRLAEVYRLPVILCCLEGRSLEEAARQLGWTIGSVKGRLERGRARLRERLMRRGLTMSAALAACETSRGAAAAAVAAGSVPLVSAAMPRAAVSPQAAAVAQDIIKCMTLAKLKTAAALTIVSCVFLVGLLSNREGNSLLMPEPEARFSPSPAAIPLELIAHPALGNNDKERLPEENSDRMEVSGRVLDPQGRPFAGAKLYVGYALRRNNEPDAVRHWPFYRQWAASGIDGRFRFTFTRSDLDERYMDASRPIVIATAEGLGLGWADIGSSAAGETISLKLVEDSPLDGRVLDAQGKPIAGAKVFVREIHSKLAAGDLRDLLATEIKSCWGPLPGQPPQVTTDAEGRFRLTGLGRDRAVTLALEGPNIFPERRMIRTGSSAATPTGMPIEWVAVAARSIRGVVRDKATGQPVAGVMMGLPRAADSPTFTFTDKEGRYELWNCTQASQLIVSAQPQSGQPYFAAVAVVPKTTGLTLVTADFELTGGIPLRGRVLDRTTGKPPKRARAEYYPLFPNVHSSVLAPLPVRLPASSASIQADGSYSLTVLPGPGVVLVAASPRDSFAVAVLDDRELSNMFRDGKDHGGGSWLHTAIGGGSQFAWKCCIDRYNALSLIQPEGAEKSLRLDVAVQSVRPLHGKLVGPDGQPIRGASVSGLSSMPEEEVLDNASFLVEGLNPQRARDLSVYHKEKRLGKFLTLRGDQMTPLTVQLEPCGVVTGRMVDEEGKPVPKVWVRFGQRDNGEGGGLDAGDKPDNQGRFRVALVPRLPYRLGLMGPYRLSKRPEAFSVESGQTYDLGEVVISQRSPTR